MTHVTKSCGKQTDTCVKIERMLAGLALGDDFHQFVGQVPVGLEERPGTYPVGSTLRLVGEMVGAYGQQLLLRAGYSFGSLPEDDNTSNLGHGTLKIFGPGSQGGTAGVRFRRDLNQQLHVIAIRKELDFVDSWRTGSTVTNYDPKGWVQHRRITR